MQTLFQKMRAHRVRWVDQPIQAQADDSWKLKAMVVYGRMYVEAPEVQGCKGCAFLGKRCSRTIKPARDAFGGSCRERSVIYIKAE